MKAMGRGSRKPAAKLAGHLETLSLIDLSIARSRGRGNISSAVVENVFPNLRQSEQILRKALEGVSVVDRLVGEEEPDEELFLLLSEFLYALDCVAEENASPSDVSLASLEDILRLGFFWKLLLRLGFGIEANRCVVGGEVLQSGDRFVFSPDAGGIVCSAHANVARQMTTMSDDAVKLLRVLLANRISSLRKLSVPRKTERSVSNALQIFIHWVGQ